MKKVLIFGAGSIGNHMSYACIKSGMKVYITDINPNALIRMKKKIYPKRYGSWNNDIELINHNDLLNFKKNFELVIIGTPPETHFDIYKFCKKKIKYKKILIEKPMINYSNKNLSNFQKIVKNDLVLCGYNHSISPSFTFFLKKILMDKKINKINVNWCEGLDGILNAHFWLKNEFDSYLGDKKKGGGSLQEHSHGLHLLLLILEKLNIKLSKSNIKTNYILKKSRNKSYDQFSNIFGFDKKIYFSYTTDFFSVPAEKKISIISSTKKYEWQCSFKKNLDIIKITSNNKTMIVKKFKKTRSSEFENEILHILKLNSISKINKSNLSPNLAFNTINLIKKIFENEKKKSVQ